MAIIKEDFGNDFIMVPREIVRDPDLSLKERGLLLTLYSLPEDFHFTLERMTELVSDGISSISSAFRSLERKGYVVSSRRRVNGRVGQKDLLLTIPCKSAHS